MRQNIGSFFPRGVDPYCKKIHGLQTGIATWIDALEGLKVHFDVQSQTVIGALAADLDA